MTATICPSSDELQAFSLGQISIEKSDELIAHIRSCDTCRSELETVDDAEDSLIATLRDPDGMAIYDAEQNCQVAVAKALGALAGAGDMDGSADSQMNIPRQFGEYEIVRPLGRGGMGRVYLARHTRLNREVALKVLAHHRLEDKRMQARFEAEMQAVGRLSHPNIVTAHDARDIAGTAVLITEYIDGFDLGTLLQRTGPISVANACDIVRQVAVALEYANGQGFVHRDVKPSNIMLGRGGEVKLLDLGLARFRLADADRPEITGTGQAMGTADYIAPEQVSDSHNVDARADIYSLGCTLFKLLSGTAPFDAPEHPTAFAKMTAHVSASPPSLSEVCPHAPKKLVTLVDSMLAKEPKLRPQSAILVAEQLAPYAKGSNLQQLAQQAASCESIPFVESRAGSDTGAPQTQPLARRRVPVSVLIATALGALAVGFACGLIVKINYPDGTSAEIHVPDGGRVTMIPAENGAGAERNSQTTASSTAPPRQETTLEFAPIFFAILEDQEHVLPSTPEPSGEPIVTDTGVWYPLANNVTVPNAKSKIDDLDEGVTLGRYALIEGDAQARIPWKEIQGHLSAQSRNVSAFPVVAGYEIELLFDKELSAKMKRLSEDYLNRQLAIIFNNRIVSAPYIRGPFGERAEITGRFKQEEVRFLMQALSGGLVEPLPSDTDPIAPEATEPDPIPQ
jgi:serine/threonine protein kinase